MHIMHDREIFNPNKVFGLNFLLLSIVLKNPLDCSRNLSPLRKGIFSENNKYRKSVYPETYENNCQNSKKIIKYRHYEKEALFRV